MTDVIDRIEVDTDGTRIRWWVTRDGRIIEITADGTETDIGEAPVPEPPAPTIDDLVAQLAEQAAANVALAALIEEMANA